MKCSISQSINKGKFSKLVDKFGAVSIVRSSSITTNMNKFTTKITTPKSYSIYNKVDDIDKLNSIIFSSTKFSPISKDITLKTAKQLKANGAFLNRGFSLAYFNKNSNKVISSSSDENRIVIEVDENDILTDTDDRAFITITSEDVRDFLSITKDNDKDTKEFNEGVEFLIVSALFRGYSVAIKGNLNSDAINSAIKRFNRTLNNTKNVRYMSKFRQGEGIQKFSDVETLLNSLNTDLENNKVPLNNIINVNTKVNLLNGFLSESERTSLNKHRKTSNSSKIFVASKIINVFKQIIPGLTTEILTSTEILELYGSMFTGKKGFIIEGKIILNVDKFNQETLFHEFSHFYMKWLKSSNPDSYNKLMNITKEIHVNKIALTKEIYANTGLNFTENEIIEEIFAEELGMNAAEELELFVNETTLDNQNIDLDVLTDTVEGFTLNFLHKLTNNKLNSLQESKLSIRSSISEIFNIGLKFADLRKPSEFISDIGSTELESLKEFFIEEASPAEIFNGLISRGLVQNIGKDNIILKDSEGNRVDLDGNYDPKAIYKYPKDPKKRRKFITSAIRYIDKNKNIASVLFSVSVDPVNIEKLILENSKNVKLKEDGSAYELDGTTLRRTTGFLSENFTSDAETEEFILRKMWNDKVKSIKEGSTDTEDSQELNNRAITIANKLISSPNSSEYIALKKEISAIFEFKTEEGTYLHNIAEFFFRALNYSQKIDYGSAKGGGYLHFSGQIINAFDKDSERFIKYFDEFFFSRLAPEEHTTEYKSFKEGFEFLKKEFETGKNLTYARDLLKLLKSQVIPEINKLSGPLTIMPEVKLASKSLGVAGTLDLLVIDGKGRGYIFDYKTKEVGKRKNWDIKDTTGMKGVMTGYRENAMMKASIQTSIYKIILMEMGIEVGAANIFYIENEINRDAKEDALFSETEMEYRPSAILKKGLVDVSAEIIKHFKEEGRTSILHEIKNESSDIHDVIYKASGNKEIDVPNDLDVFVKAIYDSAIRVQGDTSNKELNNLIQRLSSNTGKAVGKGLRIKLPGGITEYLDPNLQSEDDHLEAIRELVINRKSVSNIEGDLEKIFHSKATNDEYSIGMGDKDLAVRSLLNGVESNTHEIYKLSSNLSFGLDSSGIVMIKDKITGETRIVVLNYDNENSLFFGKGKNNVLGNYMSNTLLSAKHPHIKMEGNTHNMRLIKTGLMIIKAKQLDPDFNVNLIVSNKQFKDNKGVPRIIDVGIILDATKVMIENMIEAGEEVPESISDMLKDPKLFESKTYIKNPIEALSNYLSMAEGDFFRIGDIYKGKKEKERKVTLKSVVDNYDPRQDKQLLLKRLLEYQASIEASRLKSTDEKINDPLWKLLDQVIMYIHGFNYTISPQNTGFVSNYLLTVSKTSNEMSAAFNRKIQESTTNIREAFDTFKSEHNRHIEAVAKEEGVDISNRGSSLYKSSMKRIFASMFVDPTNENRAEAFKLKSYTDNNLGPAKKAYLKFMNETMQEMYNISSYIKGEVMDGWMPLMPKSKLSARSDISVFDRTKKALKNIRFNTNFKESKDGTIDSEFSIENKFASQVPKENSLAEEQYTESRRTKLGLDYTGINPTKDADTLHPLNEIEDNLENILDNFTMSALETHHYRAVTAYGRSLFYTVRRFEKVSGKNLDQLVETIALIQKRIIHHKTSSDKNQLLGTLNKFVTGAAIAGTVGQALLETFTNPMITGANYFSDKLYGVLFKGTREFSAKSYGRAARLVWSGSKKDKDLIHSLDRIYGITSADTAALKETLKKLEKNSLFQQKTLMFVNKLMLDQWQLITMVAYMIEQGTYDAHSLDEFGNLVYDEDKDKRFNTQPGDSEKVRLTKKKSYEATKEKLASQRNGLTGSRDDNYEDRKLRRAWTSFDNNYVKEMIVELYSSMDEASKSLATYYTHFNFILKMRTWIFPKIPRYFQKPLRAEQNESISRLVEVKDPDADGGFRMEWKGQPSEGIAYTLFSMLKQTAEFKHKVFTKGTLDEHQKKNMSKLLSDVIVSSMLALAAYGVFSMLDKEDKKGEMAQLVYHRWLMATGDVFLIKSLVDMGTGNSSMFIGVSIAYRAVSSAFTAAYIGPQALVDPDITSEDVLAAVNQVALNSSGAWKTINMAYNGIIQDD